MREMRATFENKKCGGGKEANHNDRSFDVSEAENISADYVQKDQVWVFPDGEPSRRLPLGEHALRDYELDYYRERFGSAVDAQRERHLKHRQKARAEGCTVERYYNSTKTGPESSILQLGKEWEYKDQKKFVKMVNIFKGTIEEETDEARIKVLSISVHASEEDGSLHVHMTKSFEVWGKDGWEQNTEKCLEKLGYTLPDATKKKSQYNNRKMTWTEQAREKWYDIIERVDPEIKINRVPDPDNPKTKGKVNKAIREINVLRRELRELRDALKDLERNIDNLDKGDLQARKDALKKAVKNAKVKFGKLSDYVGLNEPQKAPQEAPEDAETVENLVEEWER